MCIIVYKPSGIKFPSNDILETCFNHNQDGAGFMFPDKGGVHVRKGFMDYASFAKAIEPLRDATDLPVVMHFRISTHAGVNPEMTQPFPLSKKTKQLKKTDVVSNIGVAHNGIIQLTNDAKTISDTALFIKRYMSRLVKRLDYYKDNWTAPVIERLIGSKMAILGKDGHCELLGSGWTQDDGIWYSNTSYKGYRYKSYYGNYSAGYYYNGKWYSWDDDYDDYDGYYYGSYKRDKDKDTKGKVYSYSKQETVLSPVDVEITEPEDEETEKGLLDDYEMSDEERAEWLDYRENCELRKENEINCLSCLYRECCFYV